ncbi:MAG TPA: mercuric reductase [Acidobacteriaceae bacterium]|nr:mercuric reductase [Acidobacteriaceae bacterium]
MSDKTHYDAIILGSGQAGNPLAGALSANGKRTALVERAAAGGTCGNYGCTPTKTMVASAEVAELARRAAEYGIKVGAVSVDMPAVRERKRGMVKKWREGSEKRLKDAGLVDLIYGEASFAGPRQVLVRLREGGERRLSADLIVIDTGLSPALPQLPGLESVPHLDNVSIMELDELPEHLLVLGGGYVGLEFAQMFRRFGSRVSIVHNGQQLLTQEDSDVADEIAKVLREDGIEILLDAQAHSVTSSGSGLRLTVQADGANREIEGTHLLVATGRRPNTGGLNLAAAGIAIDERGYIRVDDKLRTTAEGVYAAGDVKGGPAFTHISYDDYRVLKANLLNGEDRSIAGRMLPYCVFIDPQLGRIGLSERQAREQGRRVRVAKMPMTSVARALETSRSRGFMKALVDPESEEIVGAAVLGDQGGELMSLLQVAMMGKLKYTVLRDSILAHPTFAEAVNNLFGHFEEEDRSTA